MVRKILLGAAEASLDIAGAAVLPGAWPILKGALTPVLERLKERLGGEDVTASKEKAEEAAAAFESDTHLQEMLRTRLLSDLDRIATSGEQIQEDVQKLMLVVAGNQDLLVQLIGGVDEIQRTLDEGVNLSDEAVLKLTEAVAAQAERSRQAQRLALREMAPVASLLRRQIRRLQLRAVELVQEDAVDRAADEVQEGLQVLAVLLNEAPTDTELLLQLGFLYKTAAQVFDAAGNASESQQYVERGEEVFNLVVDAAGESYQDSLDLANAVHGLGNVDHQRGDYAAAIEKYKLVTRLFPAHAYAWHDLFAAYDAVIRSGGSVDLQEMRYFLDRLEQTGKGQPGLSANHIAALERRLSNLEAARLSST